MNPIFFYMNLAIEEASKSGNDIPVGCVIVRDGQVIGRGHNTREARNTALGHAELTAIQQACRTIQDWRLTGAECFVTLEPCPMCAGAMRNARISRLYFGSWNTKEGAAGTVWNLLPPDTEIYGGIQADACTALLERFFAGLRQEPPCRPEQTDD